MASSSQISHAKTISLLSLTRKKIMKDEECMFCDCLQGGLSQSLLVIGTFLHYNKSSLFATVFKSMPVQVLQHVFLCLLVTNLADLCSTIYCCSIQHLLYGFHAEQAYSRDGLIIQCSLVLSPPVLSPTSPIAKILVCPDFPH